MNRRLLMISLALCLAFAAGAWFAPAVALAEEEGAGQDDIKAKIKKKMEEILRLMAENERALLELSTGAAGRPKRVDVEVPDLPEGGKAKGGDAKGGGGEGGTSGGAGKKGEDIARRLRELIEGQRSSGARIPKEIEELLRMIPSSQGKGQGPPQESSRSKGKKDETSQELRDARKQLDEQKQQGSDKPERGDKSKPARSDKMRTGKPDGPETPEDGARDPKMPVWFTALPPEIRDALAGGQAEKIPQKYRHLIARYNLYLQKHGKRGR